MLDRRTLIAGIASAVPFAAASDELTTKYGFNDSQIDWLLFADGLKAAQDSNRPILMLVHATWCPYCRKTRDIYADAEVVDLLQWYVPVLVDTDRQPDVSARYAPDGGYVPRHLVLMPDGTHIAEAKGPYEENQYLIPYLDPEWLRHFLKKSWQQFRARAEAPERT